MLLSEIKKIRKKKSKKRKNFKKAKVPPIHQGFEGKSLLDVPLDKRVKLNKKSVDYYGYEK